MATALLHEAIKADQEAVPGILIRKIATINLLIAREVYIQKKFPGELGKKRIASIVRVRALDAARKIVKDNEAYLQHICTPAPKPEGVKAKASALLKSMGGKKKPLDPVCGLLHFTSRHTGIKLAAGIELIEGPVAKWDREFEVVGQFKHKIYRLKAALRLKEYEQQKPRDEQSDLAAKTKAVISARNDLQAWIDDPDNGNPLKHVCFSRYFRDMEMMIFCNVLTSGSIPHFNPLVYKDREWTHEQWAAKYLTGLDLSQIENRKAEIKLEKEATFAKWGEVAARSASATAHNEYENYLFMDQFPENNDPGDEDLYQQNDVWRIDANERVLPPFKPHHHLYAPSKPSTSGFDVVSMIFAMAIAFVAGMVICCICWLWTALTGYFVASVAKTKTTKRDEDDEESQYAVH